MKIIEVKNRTPDLTNRLLSVWESSVRATHLFLSDGEIQSIKEYVPQALNGVAHLVVAEDEAGRAVAFMGVEDGSLEMLFIAPEERGKGLGKRLIELKNMLWNDWRSTSRTRGQKVFMSTWAFRFIKEQTMTGRETLIRFYT